MRRQMIEEIPNAVRWKYHSIIEEALRWQCALPKQREMALYVEHRKITIQARRKVNPSKSVASCQVIEYSDLLTKSPSELQTLVRVFLEAIERDANGTN